MFHSDLKRGSMELLILSALDGRTRHGYEIGKILEERSDGQLLLIVETNEGDRTEDILDQLSNKLKEYSVTLAKGFEGRFYSFELQNRYGADFDLEGLRILGERFAKVR